MLSLNIHSNGTVHNINVNELDSVSSLLSSENIKDDSVDFTIISQEGQVLLPSFSFKFYGITNNSKIYIRKQLKKNLPEIPEFTSKKYRTPRLLLNPETRKNIFLQQFGFIPDRDIMQNIVDEITDPLLRIENAKIKDTQFLAFEGNAQLTRLLHNRFRQMNIKHSSTHHTFTNFATNQNSHAPSTEALPTFWKSTEKVQC